MENNKNIKVEWDFEEGRLTIRFTYLYVAVRIISHEPHRINSSSYIINDAIKTHLKGTSIRWSSQTSTANIYHYLLLEIPINYGNRYSLQKINSICLGIDKQVQEEISKLINRH